MVWCVLDHEHLSTLSVSVVQVHLHLYINVVVNLEQAFLYILFFEAYNSGLDIAVNS